MAGGKETPRQKMIGMMYLVLTALLALQVSNAVLEKFAIINGTLEGLVKASAEKNTVALKGIVDEGSKSEVQNVRQAVANAQKVREITAATVAYIDNLKKEMLKTAGAPGIDEKFINDHSSKVATMMIDKKAGSGQEFYKKLEDFRKQLEQLSGVKFETLAKAPSQLEAFKDNKKHANKDFLTFTFENTPPVAAYTSVTQIQTEVLEYETRALSALAEITGSVVIKFDQFIPMVRAKSNTVAAGAKYEAEMFLTGSSTALTSEFFKDGAKLPIVEDASGVKMGKIEFTAQGGGYDPHGLAKKQFKADITVKGQTFTQMIEYFVAQPLIKATTGNAPTLYMNCGNNVTIDVPSLGTSYNPSFNAGGGAEIIKGAKAGQVTIIPKQRKISVGVSSGGVSIGSQPFEVKNVPDPRYKAFVGSTEVDLRTGIRAAQLASLRIVAEPDANFKEEVPKDARYRIKRAEVTLGRGTTGVVKVNATNENPDLRSWVGQARPGDRVVINITDVSRRTFKDEEEKVNIKGSNGVIFVPIN